MGYKAFRICAEDCAHISAEEIAKVRQDWIGYPEFADSVLGYGFMPMIADAVINGKALQECVANPPKALPDGEVHAFCDFAWSGSGAENVLALRRGNVITLEACFHCARLGDICSEFINHFNRLGLDPSCISGDEGGGGKLVLDKFEELNWYLERFQFGAPANDSEHYASIGAEIWYEASKKIVSKGIIVPNDPTLKGQLQNRKRKINTKGKLAIETKEDMLKRGVSSPDRGDAFVGCCAPGGGYGATCVSWAQAVDLGTTGAMIRDSVGSWNPQV
jgi:phage terminase large subunit